MNQILYTGGKKRKKGEPIGIKAIVTFFTVAIILFGVVLIGEGSYALVQNSGKVSTTQKEPNVSVERQEDYVTINVTHTIAIDKIIYSWNGENQVTLQGKGRTKIAEVVDLPEGNNTLYISVYDSKGKQVNYEKQYVREGQDTTQPEIELAVEGKNIKIVARDDTAISYMTYKWGEGEEVKVEATEEGQTQIEEKVPVSEGQSKLTIKAVDANGNEATKTQDVKGATKPNVEITQDGAYLVIKVTDNDAVKRIDYTLNDVAYTTGENSLNQKEFEYRQIMQPGENVIRLKAYNVSDLMTEFYGICNYQP